MVKKTINSIIGMEVLDSRGNPTVEACVLLSDGSFGSAIAPSGSSTGSNEAVELRDGDKKRFHGNGVLKAVYHVNNEIAEGLIGVNPFNQRKIDDLLMEIDGTHNKASLGANAILAVSLAVAKACAKSINLPLYRYIGGANTFVMPTPMMNIINGGKHAANNLAIQEFMIMPVKSQSISEAIRMGSEIFHTLKKLLSQDGLSINVGDEGGFAPNFDKTTQAIEYILKAIELSKYKVGEDVMIALDAAASEFYEGGKYNIDGGKLTTTEMIEFYGNLVNKYPIFSIEDPLNETDYDGFVEITKQLGKKIQIVGDDLFCTNPTIIRKGIADKMANAVLIKPNQIGTLSQTLDAIEIAKRASYNTIISHRSGESEDTSIAHIAVATNAGQIKTGSLSRSDRIAKYNELIRIEDEIGLDVISYYNVKTGF